MIDFLRPIRLDVTGPPGIGKTTTKKELSKLYITDANGVVTNRDGRETGGFERNLIVTDEGFKNALEAGHLITETVHEIGRRPDGTILWRGIPIPELWNYPPGVIPPNGVQLILQTFGRNAPMIKERYDPELQLFYLTSSDRHGYKARLRRHCRKNNVDFDTRWATAQFYQRTQIYRKFDHIIIVDPGDLAATVQEIEEKSGLSKLPKRASAVIVG